MVYERVSKVKQNLNSCSIIRYIRYIVLLVHWFGRIFGGKESMKLFKLKKAVTLRRNVQSIHSVNNTGGRVRLRKLRYKFSPKTLGKFLHINFSHYHSYFNFLVLFFTGTLTDNSAARVDKKQKKARKLHLRGKFYPLQYLKVVILYQ